MKKIIGVLILLALFVSITSCFAEEDLTLHNGVKFGMSIEEVKRIENNLVFEDGLEIELIKEMLEDSNYSVLHADDITLGGAENSDLYYFFYNNKLVSCFYVHSGWKFFGTTLSSNENKDVISKLTEKYGQSIVLSTNTIRFNNKTYEKINGEAPSYADLGKFPDAVDWHIRRGFDGTYSLTYGQWIVPTGSDYADVMFLYTVYDSGSLDYRIISYTLRTNDEVSSVLEIIDAYEQSLNNDL